MSHFYGTVDPQNSRTVATRCGHKGTGLVVTGASWSGAVRTNLYFDEETNTDMVRVSLTKWEGNGVDKVLYNGPVGGESND